MAERLAYLDYIELWPNRAGECPMCGDWRILNHAVGWYCGPTHDAIGSTSTEYKPSEGETEAIVGGMGVCRQCHDDFHAKAA